MINFFKYNNGVLQNNQIFDNEHIATMPTTTLIATHSYTV